MPERRPADDRKIYCRPTATGRCPGSHRWGACRSSSGHRPKILSSAERIGRWPNSHPAAAGRRPLPDLYDMVQGRENPAMICRCQKVGIGEKSGGHRRIYKACDVPLSNDGMLTPGNTSLWCSCFSDNGYVCIWYGLTPDGKLTCKHILWEGGGYDR